LWLNILGQLIVYRKHLTHGSKTYQNKVKRNLNPKGQGWFGDFIIESQVDNTTVLTGVVKDQAVLHGMLVKVRDFKLVLLSVFLIANDEDELK
jgi:hypothetical protein